MSAQAATVPFTLQFVKTIGMISNVATGRGFLSPSATAISSDGRIFVLDQSLVRVTICNLDEEYLGEFATWYGDGEGDKQLGKPTDMAFDSDERLYITDETNHCVFVYDSSSEYHGKWGEEGNGKGQLSGPSGIALDSEDNVYVVDQYNNRVQKFTRDGEYVLEWGEFGQGDGQLNLPWGITVDSEDNVYVADWRNDRIQKFTSDGRFLAKYGESGDGDGQFVRPADVAVDKDGYIYVADWGNERVQVLGPDGSFQTKLRGQATLTKWTEDFFASNPDERDTRAVANLVPTLPEHLSDPYNVSSQTEPYFWGVMDLAFDAEGRLYVTEFRRHRLQIYERG